MRAGRGREEGGGAEWRGSPTGLRGWVVVNHSGREGVAR